jgi:hypothetical protein
MLAGATSHRTGKGWLDADLRGAFNARSIRIQANQPAARSLDPEAHI